MKNKLVLISLIFAVSLGLCTCQREEKAKPASVDKEDKSTASQTLLPDDRRPRHFRLQRRQNAINGSVVLSESEKEVVRVETAPVVLKNIQSQLTANGKIFAPNNRTCVISYAFPARVSQIIVRVGDWVDIGSPLITLHSDEVGKSGAEFFRAQADLELAQANFERQKRLFERGAGAQKDFLAAETELKVARANLEACEKKLHLLGFSEEEVKKMSTIHQINPIITLYSPIKAKVVEIKVVPGEMVDQSKDMMVIIDPRVLWVDAEIFEKDISRVRPGQKVEITVPAYPGKTFVGRISYVGDVLKDDTRTVTVRTEVENKDLELKPGMFATLKINLNGNREVLAVPEAAICDQRGEKFVFIPGDEGFELRKVELGARQDGFYEVISGLKEGELIVTAGSFQLKSKLLESILKEAIHD
ncbi:MAG: efflux RND transporter periplasmic adaptor subunit [Candidatus Saccharicenans sp.]|uniref:efflux RND transporter periplasmic adaptor subunit n=1 Tax=Candidatus Saccharicenans sp. TaxID=2819258 RepID=UPI00404A9899